MYINICFLGLSVLREAKTNPDRAGAWAAVYLFIYFIFCMWTNWIMLKLFCWTFFTNL